MAWQCAKCGERCCNPVDNPACWEHFDGPVEKIDRHSCVRVAWVADPEVSGLQGSIEFTPRNVQEGLPL